MKKGLVSFLVFLLALRAFAPTLMPQFQPEAGSAFQMVICTAQGVKIVSLGADGETLPTAPPHIIDDCPFCSAGTAVALRDEPPTLADVVRYASVVYGQFIEIARSHPRPKSHSARGPPRLQA